MLAAGDVDYDVHGRDYAQHRRADPRIAAMIHDALGPARTVLNVGAGAGSYEPLDRHVIAIEPSAVMRRQRPAPLVPAIAGRAEALPLDDRSVDASMALITVHQWADRAAGMRELRRVTRGPIVVMAFDSTAADHFWIFDYAPELRAAERRRDPPISELAAALGGAVDVHTIPIPHDCTDGFTEAFFARPERFLDPAVRGAQSVWRFVPPAAQSRFVVELERDLASGAWDAKYGNWRTMRVFEGSLRLVVSHPDGRTRGGRPP